MMKRSGGGDDARRRKEAGGGAERALEKTQLRGDRKRYRRHNAQLEYEHGSCDGRAYPTRFVAIWRSRSTSFTIAQVSRRQ